MQSRSRDVTRVNSRSPSRGNRCTRTRSKRIQHEMFDKLSTTTGTE